MKWLGSFARPVEIRAYADRLECWQDGRIVGCHAHSFGRGKTIFDPLHYIPVLAREPGALRNGAPFKEWDLPVSIRRVQRKLERQPGGDRQMVDKGAPSVEIIEVVFPLRDMPAIDEAVEAVR